MTEPVKLESGQEVESRWLGDQAEAVEAAADDVPIGKALRLLRMGAGITQTELARRGGPDLRTISHWETGRKLPTWRRLKSYLGALQLDLHDLQAAFDRLAKRPDRLTRRVTRMERRLIALEHWRLEETETSMDSG